MHKRNHKTECGLIEIRFSGSNVSPIPKRFLCHLVNIRLIEVHFNDFQGIEVIFFTFISMIREGVIRSFYLSSCAEECQHGFSQTEKVKTAFHLNHHTCSTPSCIMTSLKLHYKHWQILVLLCLCKKRHYALAKMIRTTFILGRHDIRCSELIFSQLLSGK